MLSLIPAVSGQDQNRDQDRVQEHLMLKDGKMYRVNEQKQTQLTTPLQLDNGATVNPDGTYQLQDRKQKRLKDGQCLDFQGNRYSNQQQFREQMQLRNQALVQEHYEFKNGQMYRWRNQTQEQLQEQVEFKNGSVIYPNGQLQKQNRKQVHLRDGECLDLNGNRYENQHRYTERMMQKGVDRTDRSPATKERMQQKSPNQRGGRNN